MDGGYYANTVKFEEILKIGPSAETLAPQTISAVFGADGSATLTFNTALNIDSGPITILQGDSVQSLRSRLPVVALEGFWVNDDDIVDIGIQVSDATLISEIAQIADLEIKANGTLEDLSGTLAGRLSLSEGERPVLAGLPFHGDFIRSRNTVKTEGFIALESGYELAKFEFTYDFSSQDGHLRSSIGPMIFGGTNISPSDIQPLGLPFVPLSGELAAQLDMSLGTTSAPQMGSLYFRELEIETGNVRIGRLNTAISFDNVWPIQTAGVQTVSIGLLQAGLPLTDVNMTFSMTSSEAFDIAALSMKFGGGQITGGPISLNLGGRESSVSFDVNGVQLSALTAQSGLGGLEADGVLSGNVSVLISSDDVIIVDGTLTTKEPGTIRYRPEQTTNDNSENAGGLALTMRALEDFRYDSLSITVSGSATKELKAALALKGSNPDVYDGYPIEFNLNLSGELANIIQDSLAGYRVPETIKRQFMAFPPPN